LIATAADRARELDCTGIEEELFGKGGLAGIRMGDDCEGPPARHLTPEVGRALVYTVAAVPTHDPQDS
jgi:hypothetical protein